MPPSYSTGPQLPQGQEKPSCCPPRLCAIDPCALVCNFIDMLPSGPLWDRAKAQVRQHYTGG